MNELLPHPLLCWYATSVAGGHRSGKQLILGDAKQYSDIKFQHISRYGLGRNDLFLDSAAMFSMILHRLMWTNLFY